MKSHDKFQEHEGNADYSDASESIAFIHEQEATWRTYKSGRNPIHGNTRLRGGDRNVEVNI